MALTPLKKLASQTAIYGLTTMMGRFLSYLLLPLYTTEFTRAEYGVVSEFYAYSAFFGILLIFGFETGYFRFAQNADKEKAYLTALNFVLVVNFVFLLLVAVFVSPLAKALQYPQHHEYFYWFALILVFDCAAQIPFARLRVEGKAVRFTGIKLAEIIITVALNLFFLVLCKHAYENSAQTIFAKLYNPSIGVGYIFLSNVIASAAKFIFLAPYFRGIFKSIDKVILKQMFWYSFPLMLMGFSAVINDMLDRAVLKFLLPYDMQTNMAQLGIYGACYKLSLVMSLFIQAFRYAAEPFFFSHNKAGEPREIYAIVMKYFVITCMGIFLVVTLYLDIFKYFIGENFREGLAVVPILLMANLFLGVYINLSIWYKLTDRTGLGALVSIGGAVLTIVLNILFIPRYGYMAAAWVTLICYVSLAVVSFLLGQKYFPIPYKLTNFFKYMAVGLSIYFCHRYIIHCQIAIQLSPFLVSSIFMLSFLLFVGLENIKIKSRFR